jgi:MFS family permease
MDHAGAIIGPLIATVFLFFMPGQYRVLFMLTAIPGALAVATLFFVREPEREMPPPVAKQHASAQDAPLPMRLYVVLGIILLFSLGNSADAFLLLRLSDALGAATYVPLLWAALHVVKASLSTWGGGLSDRFGRRRVIAVGWAIYAAVYLGFAVATSASAFIALFLVYGVHFALSEGAEKALVADLTPSRRQGTAFGLYNAALGIGALLASIGFGYLYQSFGAPAAFRVGAGLAGLAAALLLMAPTSSTSSTSSTFPLLPL